MPPCRRRPDAGTVAQWLPLAITWLTVMSAAATLQGDATAATVTAVDLELELSSGAVQTVDAREVSFTWDIYALAPAPMSRSSPFNLTDPRIVSLVAALRPMVLRISGTGCENTQLGGDPGIYVPLPPPVNASLRPGGGGTHPVNVTPSDWNRVTAFAGAIDADVVLGLNHLLRDWPDGGVTGTCNASSAGTSGAPAGQPAESLSSSSSSSLATTTTSSSSCDWQPRNARAWLEHNRATLPAGRVLGYELGNEPGCYMDEVGISGTQYAQDFAALRALIAEVYGNRNNVSVSPSPSLPSPDAIGSNALASSSSAPPQPLVIGPDVGGCRHADEMGIVLQAQPPLDVITFHHYVVSPFEHKPPQPPLTVADFVAAALSNVTELAVASYAALRDQYTPATPLWLGEGSTTYSQPLDRSFAALYNFVNILKHTGLRGVDLFADQALGNLFDTAATAAVGDGDGAGGGEPAGGTAVVSGAALFKSHARVHDAAALSPAPSPAPVPTALFWLALLWKRLMGQRVYVAAGDGAAAKLVAAVRSARDPHAAAAVAAVNLRNATQVLSIAEKGAAATTAAAGRAQRQPQLTQCDVYLLEPASDPSGSGALLNGELLALGADGALPALEPRRGSCDGIRMGPLSVAFVVATR